jgi:hypothetical protein
MKNETLSIEEKNLLLYCLTEYKPELIEKAGLLDSEFVDAGTIREMREAVSSELKLKGFKINWEPNEFGLKLLNLIDRLADLYLKPD